MTRFLHDPWVFYEPLALHAPVLFTLCENKEISVAHALHEYLFYLEDGYIMSLGYNGRRFGKMQLVFS